MSRQGYHLSKLLDFYNWSYFIDRWTSQFRFLKIFIYKTQQYSSKIIIYCWIVPFEFWSYQSLWFQKNVLGIFISYWLWDVSNCKHIFFPLDMWKVKTRSPFGKCTRLWSLIRFNWPYNLSVLFIKGVLRKIVAFRKNSGAHWVLLACSFCNNFRS